MTLYAEYKVPKTSILVKIELSPKLRQPITIELKLIVVLSKWRNARKVFNFFVIN